MFPLTEEGRRYFARAGHGLFAAVGALGLEAGDEILVPSYHHGAEIEALARAGLALRYYEPGSQLEPDARELDGLITPRTRALYLIHHLGFPQDASSWRRWADQRDLLLLEDAAQAWLASVDGRPVGSFGDGAIFAPHMTFGLPDGAVALLGGGRNWASTAPASSARWAPGVVASYIAIGLPTSRSSGAQRPDIALGDPHSVASAATTFLVDRVVNEVVAPRRRANYEQLLSELGDRVAPPFDRLPEGAVPLAFPIQADDRAALRGRLADRGVIATELWPVAHPSLPAAGFAATDARRRSTLAVPVHHRLRPNDLERIVTIVQGKTPARKGVRTEVHEDLDALDAEWDELALASANVFATREWLSAWWRHFGHGRRLVLSTVRHSDGRLLAILPLYVWRERPLRILRFLGHGAGDQLGPICAPADRVVVAREIRRLLAEGAWGADVLLGDLLAGADGWGGRLGAQTLRWTSSPVLRFGRGGWAGFLAGRSANFRSQLGRGERRLAREHELAFRLAGPETVRADLDSL